MKQLLIAAFGLSLAALCNADPAVQTVSLTVKERMEKLERIDVTADKPTSDQAEPLDAELLAILEETEALEAEATAR